MSAIDDLARACERITKADAEFPHLTLIRAQANKRLERATRNSDAWREACSLLALLDGIDDAIEAYNELPFDVRFPFGGAA